jgi:hypothetical protein
MASQLELQLFLEKLLGTKEVYFQEPSNALMKYPAVVYHLDELAVQHANNNPYTQNRRYEVTVMDRNPNGSFFELIAALPMCTFSRRFTADKLNHSVFNLYF